MDSAIFNLSSMKLPVEQALDSGTMKFARCFDYTPYLRYYCPCHNNSKEHIRMKFISMTRTSMKGGCHWQPEGKVDQLPMHTDTGSSF
jgi:hypothetical protein